jgi:hypothetical protein
MKACCIIFAVDCVDMRTAEGAHRTLEGFSLLSLEAIQSHQPYSTSTSSHIVSTFKLSSTFPTLMGRYGAASGSHFK